MLQVGNLDFEDAVDTLNTVETLFIQPSRFHILLVSRSLATLTTSPRASSDEELVALLFSSDMYKENEHRSFKFL